MQQKQNLVLSLLLTLWLTMFCFSVAAVALPDHPAPITYATAEWGDEILTPETKDAPVAWTEPSTSHVSAASVESQQPLYTSVSWSLLANILYFSPKPGKAVLAFASVTACFRILPNAP